MPRTSHRLLLTTVVLFAFVWLTGCSRAPIGPGSNAISDPVFVRATSLQTSSSGASVTGPLEGSADIDGDKGGELQVGRFTLTVPAGAFTGTATVTINVPNASLIHCQLGITPLSANHFAVPVVMRTDCSGTDAFDPNALTEIWFDEAAGVWRQVPGSRPDVVEFDVIAPLTHFSDYGVVEIVDGKAGW